ncbi:hypothetical protein [Sagittula marina]
MFAQPLWHGLAPPEGLRQDDLGPSLLDTDPRFDFFARWYDGISKGAPLDWSLQQRVVLIPPETWDAGIDAVAKAIAKIEDDWSSDRRGETPRAPEFEPKSVAHLFEHPRSVTATLSFATAAITDGMTQFCNVAQENRLPEFLSAMEAMPASLQRIGDILARGERSEAIEHTLCEEIGKLQARIAELESDLSKARADLELRKKPWFGKLAALSTAIAAIPGVIWTVSGDELGPKTRCEMISEYWAFFGGDPFVCDTPEVVRERPVLPHSVDT